MSQVVLGECFLQIPNKLFCEWNTKGGDFIDHLCAAPGMPLMLRRDPHTATQLAGRLRSLSWMVAEKARNENRKNTENGKNTYLVQDSFKYGRVQPGRSP